MMMAPASVAWVIARSWPRCSGVSRTMRTNRRRSLSTTSAARDSSVLVTPVAISLMVLIEHGATTMPMVWNEPDEIDAPMSAAGCTTEASALTSFGL